MRAMLDQEIIHVRDMEAEPGILESIRALGHRSQLSVPMPRDGKAPGVIILAANEPGGFSDSQVELLKTFAEQAVIAISGTETYRALQTRTADLQESLEYQTATSDVLKVISRSTFDLQPVLDTVASAALQLAEADLAMIAIREGDSNRVVTNASTSPEYDAFYRGRLVPLTRATVGGRTVLTGEVIHIEDITTDPEYVQTSATQSEQIRTGLGVPLSRDEVVTDAIIVGRRRKEPFTERQIELVSTFADQAVIAIENTRLLTEQQEALDQQTATAELLKVINASPGDLTPVFDAILEKAHTLRGAAIGDLATYDGEYMHPVAMHGWPEEWEAEARQPYRPSPAGTQLLIGGGRLINQSDLQPMRPRPPGRLGDIIERTAAKTVLVVPLRKDGAFIGQITAFRTEVRPFSEKEIALLENFATQAVIAMENARRLGELRERTAALAQRNSEFGERIEQQSATIDVLKVMSGSPDDAQPVFDLIAIRPRITRKSSPGIEAIQRRRLGKSAEHRHALSARIRSPE